MEDTGISTLFRNSHLNFEVESAVCLGISCFDFEQLLINHQSSSARIIINFANSCFAQHIIITVHTAMLSLSSVCVSSLLLLVKVSCSLYFLVDLNNLTLSQFITMWFCLSDIYILKKTKLTVELLVYFNLIKIKLFHLFFYGLSVVVSLLLSYSLFVYWCVKYSCIIIIIFINIVIWFLFF